MIKEHLKELKLKRDYPVGKRMGQLNFWKKWLKEMNVGFKDSNKGVVVSEGSFDIYYSQKAIQSARKEDPKPAQEISSSTKKIKV